MISWMTESAFIHISHLFLQAILANTISITSGFLPMPSITKMYYIHLYINQGNIPLKGGTKTRYIHTDIHKHSLISQAVGIQERQDCPALLKD